MRTEMDVLVLENQILYKKDQLNLEEKLIFCFALFPISLIMKTLGYDPLKIKNINSKSYKEVSKNDIVDLKRIF